MFSELERRGFFPGRSGMRLPLIGTMSTNFPIVIKPFSCSSFLLLEFGIARPHWCKLRWFQRPRVSALGTSHSDSSHPFFPSKVRHKVAPRWAFQLDLAPAGITIFSRCRGLRPSGQARVVAQSARVVEPPGFRDSRGWLWVTATTGEGASHCQLPAPGGALFLVLALFHGSLPCSLRLQMGALEPASFRGSSAPLAGGAVQVG